MSTKITVFFQTRTFAQRSVTLNNSLIQGKIVSNEQLQINAINRISRHLIDKIRSLQSIPKDRNYAARFEVLTIEKARYPWQESEYRWKNRRSSEREIRKWRKR